LSDLLVGGHMECAVHFRATSEDGPVREQGGKAMVGDELALRGDDGRKVSIPFEEMKRISDLEGEITIDLLDGDTVEITDAGPKHDELRRALMKGRNAVMWKDRLIDERKVLSTFRCSYELKAGPSILKGTGDVMLYDRSLIFSPDDGALFRVWLVKIRKMERAQDRLLLHHRLGSLELFDVSLGLDALADAVQRTYAALRKETESLVREIYPQISSGASVKAAEVLMDGRAALKNEITIIDPRFWTVLENRLTTSELGSKFKFLSATTKGLGRVGVMKDGRTGKVGLWFLVPMRLTDSGDIKVIAFDSQDEERGQATMLFSFDSMAEFLGHDNETAVIEALAESLRSSGFRREIICLSEYDLSMPENSRYQKAINAMPELAALRDAYIGKADHDDMWASSVRKVINEMEENED
jgi:hypothetical protein